MRLKRPLRHRMHEKRAGSCTLTPHSEASQAYSSYRRRESPGVTSSPPPTSMSLCGSPYSGFGFWGQQRILTATEGEREGGREGLPAARALAGRVSPADPHRLPTRGSAHLQTKLVAQSDQRRWRGSGVTASGSQMRSGAGQPWSLVCPHAERREYGFQPLWTKKPIRKFERCLKWALPGQCRQKG